MSTSLAGLVWLVQVPKEYLHSPDSSSKVDMILACCLGGNPSPRRSGISTARWRLSSVRPIKCSLERCWYEINEHQKLYISNTAERWGVEGEKAGANSSQVESIYSNILCSLDHPSTNWR